MRWFLAIVVAVFTGWVWFMASPYWAALDLIRAVEVRDGARLAGRINTQALRNSLARQIASESALPSSQAIGPADRQLAAAALSAAASPLLDRFLTPDGMEALLRAALAEPGRPAESRPQDGRSAPTSTVSAATRLLAASRWRGFRNVYFTLPPDRGEADRVRLQLRLSRLKWRLVSVDLSPRARDRLADAVLGR